MALGALIAAYGEADGGDGLRATLPLAGRSLLQHQVRTAAALGASPVVVLVERVPDGLVTAMDELIADGLSVALARNAGEAADALAVDAPVLLIGDGIVADRTTIERVMHAGAPAILTLPDDPGSDRWERIDGGTRWAGVALAPSDAVGDVAAMVGDWDLPSTLLRRLVQDGATRVPVRGESSAPVMARHAGELHEFERRIMTSATPSRWDWVRARLLPWVETPLVERLAPTGASPAGLLWGALGLLLLGAIFFGRGWLGAGLIACLLSTPLAGAAERLAAVRLQPLRRGPELLAALPVFASVALLALAWRLFLEAAGWGVLLAAVAVLAFAVAQRLEGRHAAHGVPAPWLLSPVNAIWAAIPFAVAGWWRAGLLVLAAWAAASFFSEQKRAHRPISAPPHPD